MTYQEKIKYAEDVLLEIKNAKSGEYIENYLKSQGLNGLDIGKVMTSAKGMLEDEIGGKLKNYMAEGSLDSKMDEFKNIDASIFESLKERAKRTILEDVKKKVEQMAAEGKTDEEIIKINANPFISKAEIGKLIDNYRMYVELPKGPEKEKNLTLGLAALLIGLPITIYGFSTDIRVFKRLGMAILVFGAYSIYINYTPKGITSGGK